MQHPWPARSGALQYISKAPSAEWVEGKRRIVLLGSTGSIGASTLDVIRRHANLFEVVALAGAFNVQSLAEQALEFRPRHLAVYDAAGAESLRALLPADYEPHIVYGQEGYESLARLPEANTVLSAQVGAAGLRGTVAAALEGKVIGLANKESLVLAGQLIRHICAQSGAVILPVDSEHNALFQMLAGRSEQHIKKLILTASGGPFRGYTREQLQHVTREQALAHPNWSMGAKITIDSASLMNKGLEVIEAYHLYGLDADQLGVVVHPQSIVHSLVEYQDNSLMAHLGSPDMRMPIGHCLAWPHCVDVGVKPLDLLTMGGLADDGKSGKGLTFTAADLDSFSCLALAMQALKEGQDMCIVLNGANEVAVELFLAGRIAFLDIARLVQEAMQGYRDGSICTKNSDNNPNIWCHMDQTSAIMQHIFNIDTATRRYVRNIAGIQESS